MKSRSKKQTIAIMGTGYVGLVAAAVFADRGFPVLTSSQDKEKVDTINAGRSPFFENDLEPIITRTVKKGKLRAVLGREEAALAADISFIAVGTPSMPDGAADLSLIRETATAIGKALAKKKGYSVIVARSTIVPGTTRNVIIPLLEEHSGKKAGRDFGVCMSPEFLRQGAAVKDTSEPDSVVIGELDKRSGTFLENFATRLYKGQKVPILRMNLESAEMVKYGRNTFLAMNISYINEMARIAETIPGIDIYEVVKGVGADWRINPAFLKAGAGYGGSCFPKDVKAIISYSRQRRVEPALLDTVEEVNEGQASHVVELAIGALGALSGKRIALLGLSFKPGTDDMRESPAVKIGKRLTAGGANVVAYDPVAIPNAKAKFIRDAFPISYAASAKECLKGADCAIVVTEWEEFAKISAATFNKLMKRSVVIDGRRIYDAPFRARVADYRGIGLGSKEGKKDISGPARMSSTPAAT